MNLEIGQHGAYPTKEVRRIPVAARTFASDGGTNRVFNSGGESGRVFSNAGGAARVFSSEEGNSRALRSEGATTRTYTSDGGTNRIFNSDGESSRVSNNAGGAARVFNSEEGRSRVSHSEGGATRAYTSAGRTNEVFSSEGGRMGKTLRADANNNQQAHIQRNISEMSSVFASGSDFETDYDAGRRNRSEALRSSSTDGRLDGNNWIATESTEVKRHAVKQNHPKGTLFGRWKMLNDEFQNKYLDHSSNAERSQAQVSRISDFDRFDNVRQVFSEGKGITNRPAPEISETNSSSYQLKSSKSYSATEPVVSKVNSLEKQSQTLVADTSKEAKHHKKDRAIIKASKKKERKLEMEHDAQFKRGKEIRAVETKKKQRQGKTIEKKTAEFVDGLIEDAWAVCIPRRRSFSMENLASTESQEKHITKGKKHRLAQAAAQYNESRHVNEDRMKMVTGKQVVSSSDEWLLENSSTVAADEKRQIQSRHFQDANAEGLSYRSDGAKGMNASTRISEYSAAESDVGMNVRTSVERFSSTAESADDLNVRTEGGRRSRTSHGSSLFDVHRGGIQQDVGRDLTHIIRPIPGSGSYTRMFSSHSRHGSGSSADRRIGSHSEGYSSDATALSSRSRGKVRWENGQAINHLVFESSRSLENLKSPTYLRPTSADDNASTTFEIRQRCWSYDNLSTDGYLEGSEHTSPSGISKELKRNRPPTLTRGMVTRVYHGCEEKLYSPGTTPSQDEKMHVQFQQIVQTPYPQHDIRTQPGRSTDYTVFLPIKDTTDAPYLNSPSTAVGRGTHSLQMTPSDSFYGRNQTGTSSPMKFHAATPDLDSPGTTFSNLPIFVADVLSPMTSDYHPESQFEGFIRRQNTMGSNISDDGGSRAASAADVHMTRDQVLNFYVFNQQTPQTSRTQETQEITRSITLGDEREPTLSRETQTAGNDRELVQRKYTAVEREPTKEAHRRIQPKGQTETIHYITHQREIETVPAAKRSVESTSAQTDLEGFFATDTERESRELPVQMRASMEVEERPTETSSFDEYSEENVRFPVIVEERGALPVRVVVAKESTSAAPLLSAEKDTEDEEFMETTVVEEKEEKICMEIREEVEFSMLRKQGTLLDRGNGVASIEPWWIPDRFEAVVDRRKIKTTKTEQLHNDEDYSLKGERHQLKDQGLVSTAKTTRQSRQIPGVQHQGKAIYHAAATDSSRGRADGSKAGAFISGRRGIGLPQRNGIHRNHYFSRQQSHQSPDSLGAFGQMIPSSSTAWKTREGKLSQKGGYSMENWSQMTESAGSGQQRIGSSYEPNNVSFGRKSDEMVLREMLDLGDSVGGKPAVQGIARSALSSDAYNGGKIIYSSQSEPVAETNLIRDEDGNLVKVTERKHTMTKTVEYPSASALEGGLRSSGQMRHFDSSYDEGSFGVNSETSETNHQGSSSDESFGKRPIKHFETMATPL